MKGRKNRTPTKLQIFQGYFKPQPDSCWISMFHHVASSWPKIQPPAALLQPPALDSLRENGWKFDENGGSLCGASQPAQRRVEPQKAMRSLKHIRLWTSHAESGQIWPTSDFFDSYWHIFLLWSIRPWTSSLIALILRGPFLTFPKPTQSWIDFGVPDMFAPQSQSNVQIVDHLWALGRAKPAATP